ncbi:MAG: DUF6273 domain-containing protein [Bacilli bacterium]|nr:DUF6273 domain-containing protein [Bacilli bacterium]
MPLMFASFLASCGPKKYTITINATEHFKPTVSALSFAEDDFTPITVPYTTDSGFVVTKTICNVEGNECTFDYLKEELIITPQKNANFSVTVSVTSLDQVSYVTIINVPPHMQMDIKSIPFAKGSRNQISFPFTIDKYCAITASVEKPDSADVKVKNNKIIVTPKCDNNINVVPTVTERYKVVKFLPNGGALSEDAQDEILMPYGKTWGECVDASTQVAKLGERTFAGWSFNRWIYDEIIDDNYVINENTPDSVNAIYYHNIELHNNRSIELEKQTYPNNNEIDLYFRFADIEHYGIPEKKDIELCGPDQIEYTYDYKRGASQIHINASLSRVTSDIIEVWVSDYRPEYECEETLSNLTLEKENNPKRGDDFVFTLTANNSQNEIYTVPQNIGITINESPIISTKAYTIEDISDGQDFTKAKVTILGRFVKGDVHITADAVTSGGYHLLANGYGVTCSIAGKYIDYSETTEIILSGDGVDSVAASNILIRMNGTDWYTCDVLPSPYNNFVTYNQTEHKIVISPNADCIQTIAFYVFLPSYSIFQNASWDTISELASLPTEQIRKFFTLGELRHVEDERYTFRIIGFSHDNLSDGNGKAGLTIETVELLTEDYSISPFLVQYSNDIKEHGCYVNGPLDNFLKDSFSTRLPYELRFYCKKVSKPSIVYSEDEYGKYYDDVYEDVEIFAISAKEYNLEDSDWKHEGEPYEYYKKNPDRKKYLIGATAPCAYWTRSHSPSYHDCALFIKGDGTWSNVIVDRSRAVAPAFCI